MNHLSPEELQHIMTEYKGWVSQLGSQYLGGQRLEESGALLPGKNEPILTDGPFLEAKEIIAGYMLIRAENQEEANNIAQTVPHLGLYTIEVRPVATPKM